MKISIAQGYTAGNSRSRDSDVGSLITECVLLTPISDQGLPMSKLPILSFYSGASLNSDQCSLPVYSLSHGWEEPGRQSGTKFWL